MLTYSFESIGSCSLYEHLYRCIQADIRAGRLAPDEKLPSKRSFARHLGVSVITVENAYAQLMAEGYIYSLPKRGFFVEPLPPAPPVQMPAPTPPPAAPVSPWAADFVTNQIPPENFPFSTWTRLLRTVLRQEDKHRMQTPSSQGCRELQTAIAQHLYAFRGMQVRPEQIVVGAGTEYLCGLLVQLLGRDAVYGVEDPCYQKPAKIYEACGAACVSIPMDRDGVRVDAVQNSGANILHLSPSHHFPTGIVMPVSRRLQLLHWCAQQPGRYILEDDYDCEFRTNGKPIPTLQSIDPTGRVIYINTFSKTLASTMRISYMVLPLPLVERFQQTLGFYTCTVSSFEQLALAEFIQSGAFESHLNRMRTHYRTQKEAILTQLAESSIASRCRVRMENEGLHFLLEVTGPISDAALLSCAARHGVRISCLSQYYRGTPACPPTLVVNYAGLGADHTHAAIALLIDSIAEALSPEPSQTPE